MPRVGAVRLLFLPSGFLRWMGYFDDDDVSDGSGECASSVSW
jgi:hypothetical protein